MATAVHCRAKKH